MSVNPTPVSPASLGSLTSFEMVAVNDGDIAQTDNDAAITLELAPDTTPSLNDVNSTMDNAFSVALRMETTLSTLYANGRNDCMSQHPVIRTTLSESNDVSKVGKYSFNGTFFHDNLRKKAARAYAEYVHPTLDSHKLAKLVTAEFLTISEINKFDFSASSVSNSYSPAMLFEGDDDCKARCRAAAGYVHPKDQDRSTSDHKDDAARKGGADNNK
mmetsp:Transcript_427/g.902  ORF Transcript_427/g.902 Transcript_427/m.902 type:complete len:215 (+) Transcript_427:82-726(+)